MSAIFPAPAKLNLDLRIVGRRADGMHLLESDLALLEFGDSVRLARRSDGAIRRRWRHAAVAEDLCVAAARALRESAGDESLGADIFVEKRIPVGGGLGGASSDAATVLLALNRLWDLRLPRARLMALGAGLGSDIPFFLSGLGRARLSGVGEKISPKKNSEGESEVKFGGEFGRAGGVIILAHPGVSASTAEVYRAHDSGLGRRGDSGLGGSGLTSGLESAIIALSRRNDLAAAACWLRPEIAECALRLGGLVGEARMTGGGSCVFAWAENAAAAEKIRAGLGDGNGKWASWTTRILDSHPLRDFAD